MAAALESCRMTASLKKWFGFDNFRHLQKDIISAVTNDCRDAIVVLPT
eukprot:gene12672-20689_t